MQQRLDKRWVALCSILLAAMLLMNTGYTYATSENNLARLQIGMSKDTVTQIMGKPDSKGEKTGEDLCSWFTYKNVGRYRYVNIWFDCVEKLVAIDKARK